jgi:hypothetical protein
MNRIHLRNNNLVYYNALHFGHDILNSPALVKQQINQDLSNSQIDFASMVDKKLVVSFTGEGHDPEIIQHLIDQLKTWPVTDMLVIFNACVDVDVLPYQAISYRDFMINHGRWFDRVKTIEPTWQVDHKFLCLMRRPSPSRAHLASKLLHNIDSLKLSFGCMSESTVLSEYQSVIPGRDLPVLIDGVVDRKSEYDEHDQSNPVFHNCLFNIVVESSSQTDPRIWRSQFITEKTFKAFGLRQIPLWMAVPGLVAQVRALGFDMFDDIIDHSYDTIVDEYQRQEKLVEQITQLNQTYSLDQCQQLRNQLNTRLEQNFQLLMLRFQTSHIVINKQLKKFEEFTPSQLLIFGDSWPHGDELDSKEMAYGQLLGQRLGIYNVKNYSSPGTGISHMILQLRAAIRDNQHKGTNKIAVFFLSGQERFMCYHDDKIVNLSIRGPRINPENNAGILQRMNDLYYKYFYSDQMRDFFTNTNIIALQSMCRKNGIQDYYIAGWQRFDFWPEVDLARIYDQGQTSCRELLNMEFDDRDGVVYNNPYFSPNQSHPNQLGHQLIADTLFDWIKSKHVDTGLNKQYTSNNNNHV